MTVKVRRLRRKKDSELIEELDERYPPASSEREACMMFRGSVDWDWYCDRPHGHDGPHLSRHGEWPRLGLPNAYWVGED